MIPVVYLSYRPDTPANDYWDQALLYALLRGEIWDMGLKFEVRDSLEGLGGAVIVFPARAQVDCIDELNADLSQLEWVLVMLTGDEESVFPVEKIKHGNCRVWVMSPRKKHEGHRFLGTGWPPQARPSLQQAYHEYMEKPLDFFFAGQITHARRRECQQQLNVMMEKMQGDFLPTQGFTEGMRHLKYFRQMAAAKVAPAPSGPETPDSFRVFEALESGCVPIVDRGPDKFDFPDYWTFFFGEEPPFPVLDTYEQLPGFTQDILDRWPDKNIEVFAWWIGKKRQMAWDLAEDIKELTGVESKEDITVIVPTSPVPLHPQTHIIEQTIYSIRHHLPTAEIILTFDGIRPEQEKLRPAYQEYIRKLLWKCNFEWHNVLPLVFKEHTHQAGMARRALELVKTPLILYVEHDAPLVTDYEIPFKDLGRAITEGDANIIRLHHEAHVLPDHEHLMLDGVQEVQGQPLRKTKQWSQRPHLASKVFYQDMLERYFRPDQKTMIEDIVHGIVQDEARDRMGWFKWRLWIYSPEGNMKRSYHTDARGAEPKFEESFK